MSEWALARDRRRRERQALPVGTWVITTVSCGKGCCPGLHGRVVRYDPDADDYKLAVDAGRDTIYARRDTFVKISD